MGRGEKYLFAYIATDGTQLARDSYFTDFLGNASSMEVRQSSRFRAEPLYRFVLRRCVALFMLVVLVSSVLNVLGIITI